MIPFRASSRFWFFALADSGRLWDAASCCCCWGCLVTCFGEGFLADMGRCCADVGLLFASALASATVPCSRPCELLAETGLLVGTCFIAYILWSFLP